MKEPIEFAIKKDVRNNPIIREIDEPRQRALWRCVRVGAFLVIIGLFSAWQHFEIIRHGYSIDQMERERAELEETERRLRLEIETLRSPQRIEALATRELRLVPPTHADALIIERVVPATPPGGTVVARR
jgi:cell division protein FtsL